MEFKLITDLSVLPKQVEFNADELKAELVPKLAYYKSLVVTEDAIRQAKTDRASLNKLRAAIDGRRKEVKAACLAPYEQFERQCREIIELIDEPILAIDTQIKAFDQKEQEEKYARLEAYFRSCMVGVEIPITLDKILNPKWTNKSMKEDTLKKEIAAKINEIQDDCKELQYAYGDTPHITAILKCYYAAYDRGAAHCYANDLINEEHRRKQEDALRALQKPQERPEPAPSEDTPEPPTNHAEEPSVPATDSKLYTCKFKATGTREQLRAARDHMLKIGIKLESV